MRKNYKLFGFAAVAALMFAGCAKDATDDVAAPEREMVYLEIVPNKTIEAMTDDGTRTYMEKDPETGIETVKWCKDEKFAFCINGVGHWTTGNLKADGNIILGMYDYPEQYEEGVPFLLAGVIPNDALGNRSEAPKKLEIRLKEKQDNGDITTYDRYCDFLVAAQWVEPERVTDAEGNDKLTVGKLYRADGYQFVRPMAISKYVFPVTNEELSAEELVESLKLTVIPGEGNDPKYLTGTLYMNIGEMPAKAIDADGNQIDLRTPFQSGSASVGITYPLDAQPKLGELVFWPVTAPVKLEAGDQLQFRIVTNQHEIIKTITLGKDLLYANNKLNRGTVKLDADTYVHAFSEAIDLSADGTANSYIVSKPRSNYKFRADVKGNGIPRDLSYTTEYANRAGSFAYTEADLKIEPKAAVILWYNCVQHTWDNWLLDCPVVIGSVKLNEEGYIEFTTPETFVNGNVVIAAIDQELTADQIEVDPATRQFTNTNILWSWNLIVSDGYDPESAAQQVTKGGYTFMTRDLGAVLDADYSLGGVEKASSQGNFYQWGRKDPFPHIPDYASNAVSAHTSLWFTPTYTTIPGLEIEEVFEAYGRKTGNQIFGNTKEYLVTYISDEVGEKDYSNEVAVDYSTKYPYRWFKQSAAGDDQQHRWIRQFENGTAFWGNPDGEMELKTIYDPCPVGWKVASEKAWRALTDDLTIKVTLGDRYFQFGGILFPVGEGHNSDGSPLGYIGSCNGDVRARYMMTNAEEFYGLMPRYFRLSSTEWNYDQHPEAAQCDPIYRDYTAIGSRIRCIKE